jgi:hypothetical protein
LLPLLPLTHTSTHIVNGYTVCTSVYVSPYSASYLDTHKQFWPLHSITDWGGENRRKRNLSKLVCFSLFLSRWHRFTSSHRVVTPAEMMTNNQPNNQTTKQPRKGGGERNKRKSNDDARFGKQIPVVSRESKVFSLVSRHHRRTLAMHSQRARKKRQNWGKK